MGTMYIYIYINIYIWMGSTNQNSNENCMGFLIECHGDLTFNRMKWDEMKLNGIDGMKWYGMGMHK